MGLVLDYSNWRPPQGAKQLKAAGIVGVARYIAPAAWNWPKAVTPLERMDLDANGIDLALNFEAGVSDYLGGRAKGTAHGTAILAALHELAVPADAPVYVSIDTSVPVANFGIAEQYIAGIRSLTGSRPLGLYGEGALIEDLATKGLIQYGWESESTAFPGNSAPTAHTVLVQKYNQQVPAVSGAYDVNVVLKPDWGQIKRPAAPAPTGTSKVTQQFQPGKTFVATFYLPGSGAWGLQADWGVITIGGNFHGTMFGNAAVKGRTPARIVLAGAVVDGAAPPLASYPPSAVYECIATSGERYLPKAP